jgi:hypothetical protein
MTFPDILTIIKIRIPTISLEKLVGIIEEHKEETRQQTAEEQAMMLNMLTASIGGKVVNRHG